VTIVLTRTLPFFVALLAGPFVATGLYRAGASTAVAALVVAAVAGLLATRGTRLRWAAAGLVVGFLADLVFLWWLSSIWGV
jgi:hypothetical protein